MHYCYVAYLDKKGHMFRLSGFYIQTRIYMAQRVSLLEYRSNRIQYITIYAFRRRRTLNPYTLLTFNVL